MRFCAASVEVRLRESVPLGEGKRAGVNLACRWGAGWLAVSPGLRLDVTLSSVWHATRRVSHKSSPQELSTRVSVRCIKVANKSVLQLCCPLTAKF